MSVWVPAMRSGVPSGARATTLPRLRIQRHSPDLAFMRHSMSNRLALSVVTGVSKDARGRRSSGWSSFCPPSKVGSMSAKV
ncbi:hypothetical protein D3C83_80930 [compost metagenome]